MGVIHWQDKDKDMGILYECDTDGKGNVTKTTYLDTKRQARFLEKMVKNVARTVREELIQHPEVIPVFLEFLSKRQRFAMTAKKRLLSILVITMIM